MSRLNQFFPSVPSGGGGGGSHLDAKILVVGGGGGGGIIGYTDGPGRPSSCSHYYGAAGGVIYTETALKPGAVCPIQVGTGATSSTDIICCVWKCCPGPAPTTPTYCLFRCFQDGLEGNPSYFGGITGYCAQGGQTTWTPTPGEGTPSADCGTLSFTTGATSTGRRGTRECIENYFQTGFQASGAQTLVTLGSDFAYSCRRYLSISPGQAGSSSILDSCNEYIASNTTPARPNCIGCHEMSPSGSFKQSGFYHELLGTGQVVGGAHLGYSQCLAQFNPGCPSIQATCCSHNDQILRPTYPDALKNWGGYGAGSGVGGFVTGNLDGSPGAVIIQYPNCCGAVAAPARPGSIDCSPNTPGFYTYYYLTPGSITLP